MPQSQTTVVTHCTYVTERRHLHDRKNTMKLKQQALSTLSSPRLLQNIKMTLRTTLQSINQAARCIIITCIFECLINHVPLDIDLHLYLSSRLMTS